MSLHNFSEYPREIPISFLRVGRFVDANEEKSECLLCERGGFATFVRL